MTEKFALPFDFKIISGGQTGADRAGLDWAIDHGVPHGGWCPKGRRAEDGPIPAKYALRETRSESYLVRTRWNVRDSDATVIFTFSDELTGGSWQTYDFAVSQRKPCLHLNWLAGSDELARFLRRYNVRILNVAGSRESSARGIWDRVYGTLDRTLCVARSAQQGPACSQ